MRVVIEAGPDNGFGIQYRLKLLDGYRAGQFVRNSASDEPLFDALFDVDRARLTTWARDTGYEVVSGSMLSSGKQDTPADLAVFRESRANSPVGEAMRKHLKL
jgi:hypothetical protein